MAGRHSWTERWHRFQSRRSLWRARHEEGTGKWTSEYEAQIFQPSLWYNLSPSLREGRILLRHVCNGLCFVLSFYRLYGELSFAFGFISRVVEVAMQTSRNLLLTRTMTGTNCHSTGGCSLFILIRAWANSDQKFKKWFKFGCEYSGSRLRVKLDISLASLQFCLQKFVLGVTV